MTTLEKRPNSALLAVDVQSGVVTETHERDRSSRTAPAWSKGAAGTRPVAWVQRSDARGCERALRFRRTSNYAFGPLDRVRIRAVLALGA